MTKKYTRTAIGLHWLLALGLSCSFCLGLYMSDLPLSPQKLQLYSWHKWAGVTLFLLVLVRPGSQGPGFVSAVGSAMSNLVSASTGGSAANFG